jgi:hypothetical protein
MVDKDEEHHRNMELHHAFRQKELKEKGQAVIDAEERLLKARFHLAVSKRDHPGDLEAIKSNEDTVKMREDLLENLRKVRASELAAEKAAAEKAAAEKPAAGAGTAGGRRRRKSRKSRKSRRRRRTLRK